MFVSWLRLVGLMVVSAWLASGCTSAKKIDVGGTCILNSDCNGSLVCTWGKCHDACHTSADCPTGQSCVNTDDASICQLPAEGECSAALPCGGTLVCASDQHCRTPCQSRTACTIEQVCVSGVCAAPAELDPNSQLPVSGSGSAADAGVDAQACGDPGPGGLFWSLSKSGAAQASWTVPVSQNEIHLSASNPAQSSSGAAGSLSCPPSSTDLSHYDEAVLEAIVPLGQRFDFGINSSGQAGCNWALTGTGSVATYVIPLAAPTNCWPCDLCGYSLLATHVWIGTDWNTSSSIDVRVTALSFRTTTAAAGAIGVGGMRVGVNGWHWCLYEDGTGGMVNWVGASSTAGVRVSGTGPTSDGVGMIASIQPAPIDLSTLRYAVFDAAAVVTGGQGVFDFRLVASTSTASYMVTAQPGLATYTVDLRTPLECFDTTVSALVSCSAFNYTNITEVMFGDVWFLSSSVDIDLRSLRFTN